MKNLLTARCWVTALLLFLALHNLLAQPQTLTAGQWRNDLAFLQKELPKLHREPFNKISAQAFDSAVADLDSRIPTLKDYEVIVGLTKLVAMIGDGHTRLTLPQDLAVAYSRAHSTTPPPSDSSLFLNHLPVKLELFEDGLFIKAATPAHKDLIGSQVLRIGTNTAEAAIEKVRPVVHYDNEMGFKLLAPTFLVVPEFLASLGLSDNAQQAKLKLRTPQGEVKDVILTPVPLFKAQSFVEAAEAQNIPAPLHLRNKTSKYWMEPLPEHKALYVQVNELYNKDDEPLTVFVARIEKAIATTPVEKLILDIRHNPGGSNSFGRPILLALARSERINQFGCLYTIIGRETFSAAQMLANDMEFFTNTLFVGEPSGSSPSAYGDSRKLQLPSSNLTIRASTIYWRDWSGNEKRPWTAPDIPVPYTSKDYLNGRDPALEAILKLPANGNLGTVMQQVYEHSGFKPATWVYVRSLLDSRTDIATLENTEKAFGTYLLQEKKSEDAGIWYNYMSNQHPKAVWPMVGLAQAQLLNKEPQKAEATLEKALALDPENKEAKGLLSSIRKKKTKG